MQSEKQALQFHVAWKIATFNIGWIFELSLDKAT